MADEIQQAEGRAISNTDDVASWSGAERLVQSAIAAFGRLDALVCNAGNLLDRELVDISQRDWETVTRVHMNGHASPVAPCSPALARGSRGNGRRVRQARGTHLVCGGDIWGDAGRTNYSSAKAGIMLLSRTAATELARYGACVNVIAPFTRSRMTVSLDADPASVPQPDRFDPLDPANVSPLVVWLCSDQAAAVTGEVFEVHAGHEGLVEPPRRGPHVDADGRWKPTDLGLVINRLLAARSDAPR